MLDQDRQQEVRVLPCPQLTTLLVVVSNKMSNKSNGDVTNQIFLLVTERPAEHIKQDHCPWTKLH